MKQIKGANNKEINVKQLDICGGCGEVILPTHRRISLNVYDEIIKNGELYVKNAWNIVSYHKKCSPIKINDKIFETNKRSK